MSNEYTYELEGIRIEIEDSKSKADSQERLKAYSMIYIRNITGMNRKEFAEWLGIPYRTISDWEHGEREMPDYVLRLIAYKVKMEYIEKKRG